MDVVEKQIILIECLLIYGLLNRIIFQGKIKRYWMAVIAPIIYGGILICIQEKTSFIMVMLAVIFISYCVMLDDVIKQKIFQLSMITILYFAINEIIDAVLELCGLYMSGLYNLRLIQNQLLFIFLLCISLFIKKNKKKANEKDIVSYQKEKSIYVIVMIMAGAVYMNVSLMRYIIIDIQNEKFAIFYHIITVVSLCSIIVMLFLVRHIMNANKVANRLLENEKQLNEMQEIYYKTLLEREENTKRFMHDVKAHMLCLESLVCNEEVQEAQEYIENICQELKSVSGKQYYSGNDMVDILLNYYLAQVDECAEIHVFGRWDNQMNISRSGICTICSNLLKNAVEEVNRCEENKYIVVKLVKGKQYSQVEVSNSVSKKYKNLSKWKPQEEKNHGYGLRNVREFVEKNNGSMEIEISDVEYKITICV